MKNKKTILLVVFLALVLVQVSLVVNKLCVWYDVIKNGETIKIEAKPDLFSGCCHNKNKLFVANNWFYLDFKNDIDLLAQLIEKNMASPKPSKYIKLREYEIDLYLNLQPDKSGLWKIVSYSQDIPKSNVYYKTKSWDCILGDIDGKQEFYDCPKLECWRPPIKLTYTRKELSIIFREYNATLGKERKCIGVYRYKDGIFIPVDLIFNGKSLNKLVGKKEF